MVFLDKIIIPVIMLKLKKSIVLYHSTNLSDQLWAQSEHFEK